MGEGTVVAEVLLVVTTMDEEGAGVEMMVVVATSRLVAGEGIGSVVDVAMAAVEKGVRTLEVVIDWNVLDGSDPELEEKPRLNNSVVRTQQRRSTVAS